jgi:hypothetical protein
MSYTRQKKKNCHSALTPHHESVHKGELRLHAFLALAFERGEWCHLLVLEQNVIHLLLTKIKKSNYSLYINVANVLYYATSSIKLDWNII